MKTNEPVEMLYFLIRMMPSLSLTDTWRICPELLSLTEKIYVKVDVAFRWARSLIRTNDFPTPKRERRRIRVIEKFIWNKSCD